MEICQEVISFFAMLGFPLVGQFSIFNHLCFLAALLWRDSKKWVGDGGEVHHQMKKVISQT